MSEWISFIVVVVVVGVAGLVDRGAILRIRQIVGWSSSTGPLAETPITVFGTAASLLYTSSAAAAGPSCR